MSVVVMKLVTYLCHMGSSYIHATKYYKNIRIESCFVEALGHDFCCIYSGLLDLGLEILASVLEGCFVGKQTKIRASAA